MLDRKRIAALFTLIVLSAVAPSAVLAADGPETIERIEPPFWWQGFVHKELQLLVYGQDIAGFDVSIDYPGVSIKRVERVDNDNYLFVYIDIGPDAKPGKLALRFTNGEQRLSRDYELRQKNADAAHVSGFTTADSIYLITPDRFANGDPGNDTVDALGDALDREDDYGRHGGDLAGIRDRLDYIRDMGFTAIWLNPVLENAMPESSYHGYAITDFYEVDPRYGSNDDYIALADEMRAQGLGLVMDMIANHSGVEHWFIRDLPTPDWINHPEALTDREAYRGSSHMRTTNQDPYASAFDRREHADGWFVPTMPDLNQRNPLLADYLIQNTLWWTELLGLSGIRMDTHPYPDKQYMSDWSRRVMAEYPNLTLTGEEWTSNPAIVSYWQRGKINHDDYVSHMPSMLDFPLQSAFSKSLTGPEPPWGSVWSPAYEMLGNDFLYPDPFRLVTFPDNHDMSRIYTQVDENFDLFRMAMVYYATMRGIPSFYYGTEVLLSHPGTDSHGAIREEFPGGWPDHNKNAFTGEGLTAREQSAQALVRKLLTWRKQKPVVHDGALMQYAPIGNVYTYFRYDGNDTVMVVLHRGEQPGSLDTSRFYERLGDSQRASDVLTGRHYALDRPIPLEPQSALLLELYP